MADSPGFILWLTGLSGAGKSTISGAIAPRIAAAGRRVELLDGDVVRTHLSKGLTFSREDRDINVRRIGWVADLVARHGGVAVVAAISPFREVREELCRTYANFVEVYVSATVDECARRDVKGLYARALAGEIGNFTGVSDPYEPPTNADVVVETARQSVDECVEAILGHLRSRGLLQG
jgi:adenylylsulfate kinase